MIRLNKSDIPGLTGLHFDVGGDDKTVDHIILECVMISSRIRLVQRAACRNIAVHQTLPVISELLCVDRAGLPLAFLLRIGADVCIVESLVEIAACYDIVSFRGFLVEDVPQRFRLRDLALPVIESFQMQVDQDQFLF